MTLGSWSGLLRGARPLGQLVWWVSSGQGAPVNDVHERWRAAGLPVVTGGLPGALEQTMAALAAVPLLERGGVFWLAPELSSQVDALRLALSQFRGWELHTVPVRATDDTLEALRASARCFIDTTLASLSEELESLLTQPRLRASLLVRRLDALEALRAQAGLHARHLELHHAGLGARLDQWAARIDAALCARIVA